MNRCSVHSHRLAAGLVAVIVLLGTVPGLAAAAPVQGVSGSIVVEAGETVSGIQGVAGSVVIRGTVTGDVQVAAGTVVIDGVVRGDVEVATGSLTIGEDGVVGGRLAAGAGSVVVAGEVVGGSTIAAEEILLGPTATFGDDLRYDGNLDDRGATIEGRLIRDESLGGVTLQPFRGIGGLALDVYGLLVTFVLGAVLLLAFPAGTDAVRSRVRDDPLMSGLYGLAVLVGVPVLLVLVAITIIGIPLAIVGALLFALAAWAASVLGRYAVGTWLLGRVGGENRWLALLVGLLVVAVVGLVPVLGGLVRLVVLLLGLGALGAVGAEAFRGRRAGGSD